MIFVVVKLIAVFAMRDVGMFEADFDASTQNGMGLCYGIHTLGNVPAHMLETRAW